MAETRVSDGMSAGGRRLSRLQLLGIGLAALPVLAGWTAYARSAGMEGDAIRLPLFAAIIWGVAFTFLSWRKLDEGGKEAIKFAFCWGAGPGMMIVATTALVVILWPQPVGEAVSEAVKGYVAAREPEPGAWRPETIGFFLGAAFAIVIQQVLFVWVWVGWWLRRRLGPQ
jgi:hypothetical protein